MSINETVTLSIETYEEMKVEIKSLRQQVKEKTIIKEVLPPIYGYVVLAILYVVFVWITLY